jgi:AraC-like DNA-binding protein/CheY-like chemotaxis protein
VQDAALCKLRTAAHTSTTLLRTLNPACVTEGFNTGIINTGITTVTRPPTTFWVDMLAGQAGTDVPPLLEQTFDVMRLQADGTTGERIAEESPLCVFYDCDYPDRERLESIRLLKESYPSVPFVLVTLQHSEKLAVWTFRNGALDYLVKPIEIDELRQCLKRLQQIAQFRNSGGGRKIYKAAVEIPQTISHSSRDSGDKLAPAIYFVRQNYAKRIFSDAVAQQCGLSPTYFSKVFRQRFGMPFQEFLLRYRVAQACLMLENPNSSISDVCYAVGFKDPSYFTRVFKRYLDISPSEYCKAGSRDRLPADIRTSMDESAGSTSQIVRSLAGYFG